MNRFPKCDVRNFVKSVNILTKLIVVNGTIKSKLRVCMSLFLLYALKKDPARLFQNGVFRINQLNLLLKPLYTILKQPLNLTMLGHSKKRNTHTREYA